MDVNTLTPVWVVDTDDNIDSTPALDIEDGEKVVLYTGNTITNRTSSKARASIRRIDALSGEVEWTYEIPDVAYVAKNKDTGVYASPVVGQESISDLVIFTISNDKQPAQVLALNKADGTVKWQTALEGPSISSPVAVYNEDGDAWLVQAEESGKIHLMNAKTGKIVNTLQLEPTEKPDAKIVLEASPAVYGNLMVIGTMGTNAGGVYCIKID